MCMGKILETIHSTFLPLVSFSLCAFLLTVFVLCVLSSHVYLFVILCVYCCFTLDAGPLANSQYPVSPVTGHLSTGFSWFPCVYKRTLGWFPSFQVATTCLSCCPPDLNFLVTFFPYLFTCKITTATG